MKHINKPSENKSVGFYSEKRRNNLMKIERYKNNKGEKWVRIKFMNTAKTEVIMSEKEFVKRYGKLY